MLVEGQHHVEEGIGQLLLVIGWWGVLNGVQKEHDIAHIPLVWMHTSMWVRMAPNHKTTTILSKEDCTLCM